MVQIEDVGLSIFRQQRFVREPEAPEMASNHILDLLLRQFGFSFVGLSGREKGGNRFLHPGGCPAPSSCPRHVWRRSTAGSGRCQNWPEKKCGWAPCCRTGFPDRRQRNWTCCTPPGASSIKFVAVVGAGREDGEATAREALLGKRHPRRGA